MKKSTVPHFQTLIYSTHLSLMSGWLPGDMGTFRIGGGPKVISLSLCPNQQKASELLQSLVRPAPPPLVCKSPPQLVSRGPWLHAGTVACWEVTRTCQAFKGQLAFACAPMRGFLRRVAQTGDGTRPLALCSLTHVCRTAAELSPNSHPQMAWLCLTLALPLWLAF